MIEVLGFLKKISKISILISNINVPNLPIIIICPYRYKYEYYFREIEFLQ